MSKRLWRGAVMGLAASLALGTAARAEVVNFDNIAFAPNVDGTFGVMSVPNSFDNAGLNFYSVAYIVPTQLSDGLGDIFPTAFSSNFYEYDPVTDPVGLVVTRTGGGLFSLDSLKIGLGIGAPGEAETDTLHVSWVRGGDCAPACTGGEDIALGLGFATVDFGLTNLTSITFGDPSVMRYVAIDDFATNVPEPAAWSLMITGFAAVGAMIRRRRRDAALTTA